MTDQPRTPTSKPRIAWWAALIALIAIALAAALVVVADDDEGAAPSTTTTSTSTPTSTSTTSTTSQTTTTSTIDLPGQVSGVKALEGAGSGEVELAWRATERATGYRVLRSMTEGGSFTTVADINVINGEATGDSDVMNIWTREHSYIPPRGMLESPDTSADFQYVELATTGHRCYQVVAYNAGGEGQRSSVTCADVR